jgi:hypothetical protein
MSEVIATSGAHSIEKSGIRDLGNRMEESIQGKGSQRDQPLRSTCAAPLFDHLAFDGKRHWIESVGAQKEFRALAFLHGHARRNVRASPAAAHLHSADKRVTQVRGDAVDALLVPGVVACRRHSCQNDVRALFGVTPKLCGMNERRYG